MLSSETKNLITTRDYRETDKPFVLACWLRGLYYGNSWFSLVPKQIFMENYHKFLENLLTSPGVEIKVSCLKEDEDVILGYCVYSNTVMHWTFTKRAWRGIGVARSLSPANLTAVTHLTDVGKKILPKLPGVYFNPFL